MDNVLKVTTGAEEQQESDILATSRDEGAQLQQHLRDLQLYLDENGETKEGVLMVVQIGENYTAIFTPLGQIIPIEGCFDIETNLVKQSNEAGLVSDLAPPLDHAELAAVDTRVIPAMDCKIAARRVSQKCKVYRKSRPPRKCQTPFHLRNDFCYNLPPSNKPLSPRKRNRPRHLDD